MDKMEKMERAESVLLYPRGLLAELLLICTPETYMIHDSHLAGLQLAI
jgi:hypothetical protein